MIILGAVLSYRVVQFVYVLEVPRKVGKVGLPSGNDE